MVNFLMIILLKAIAALKTTHDCKNDSTVEYTGESRLPCGEYNGEFRLPGSGFTGESLLKSNNSSIVVLKSKLFLRMSNETRRSCLTKQSDTKVVSLSLKGKATSRRYKARRKPVTSKIIFFTLFK
jgi:hypothetical protein